MQKYKFIFIIITFIFLPGYLLSQSNWELQKENENLQVYFKQSGEETYRVRVKTSFPVNYNVLIEEVYDNIKTYPEWIYRCEQAKWLDKNKNNRVLYTVSNIPWPFQDRDVVTKMAKPQRQGKKIILHSHSIPDYIPEKDKFERQQFSEVYWHLFPDGGNNVRVTYELTLKIKENIPEFILKMIACKGPFESFNNLHARLSEK
ncbi:MAG: hypothetical protein ACQES1_01850 [Bacteroidota bacterium]